MHIADIEHARLPSGGKAHQAVCIADALPIKQWAGEGVSMAAVVNFLHAPVTALDGERSQRCAA